MKFSLVKINNLLVAVALLILISACSETVETSNNRLHYYCNPLNISYRFCLEEPSRREAADPVVINYMDKYFLFASKLGGYWYSDNLTDWNFVKTDDIPIEDYAPTVIVIDSTIYFMASSHSPNTIYKSINPFEGKWKALEKKLPIAVWDPAFFLDDDKRLYLYWGCSDSKPLYGVELDYNNDFSLKSEPCELLKANPGEHGWEVPGDYNNIDKSPWIEGVWLTKHNNKYYLEYSAPGTEFKSYACGVYVSDSPLGAYIYQSHNPFVYKPEGFANGAGHGNTFQDKYGNYWHIGTITISQKHIFERRLSLFPVFFDKDGIMYSNTKFGDFPYIIPDKKINSSADLFSEYMLLSHKKRVYVSSFIDSLPPENITDEDIRTYWAAVSGEKGEYMIMDLKSIYDVYFLQINFAEHGTNTFGRDKNFANKYIVSFSEDSVNWKVVLDKSDNIFDLSHFSYSLPEKISCRYLKIENIEVSDGNFALSGFRVFGKGKGSLPEGISEIHAHRNPKDRRSIKIEWTKSSNSTGYNICYGIDKNKLYQTYMIFEDTSVEINSLNVNQKYWFTVEAFNESGTTKSNLYTNVE